MPISLKLMNKKTNKIFSQYNPLYMALFGFRVYFHSSICHDILKSLEKRLFLSISVAHHQHGGQNILFIVLVSRHVDTILSGSKICFLKTIWLCIDRLKTEQSRLSVRGYMKAIILA